MTRQLLTTDPLLTGQRMPHGADRDHLDAAQRPTLQRGGNLLVMEEQPQVRASLDQLARHIP